MPLTLQVVSGYCYKAGGRILKSDKRDCEKFITETDFVKCDLLEPDNTDYSTFTESENETD